MTDNVILFDDDEDTEEFSIPTVRFCKHCKIYYPNSALEINYTALGLPVTECPMCKGVIDDS